jgi:hypothetical protein
VIVFLLSLVAFLFFMICWTADMLADAWEIIVELGEEVPGARSLIAKCRRLGAWTMPLQRPMVSLDRCLKKIGL